MLRHHNFGDEDSVHKIFPRTAVMFVPDAVKGDMDLRAHIRH